MNSSKSKPRNLLINQYNPHRSPVVLPLRLDSVSGLLIGEHSFKSMVGGEGKDMAKNKDVLKWLYIGYDFRGIYKIGVAKDLDVRLKQHKTSNPNFNYVFYFQDYYANELERGLHYEFADKRLVGEWFALSYADFEKIVRRYGGVDVTDEWLTTAKNKLRFSETEAESGRL